MDFRYGDDRDWFLEKRFGLFVHWGLYAIDGWHEQAQYRARIPRSTYAALASRFNPVKFDPERWLDTAQATGMEYLVFTTKHIDGFCLWDTKYTDYSIMHTPFGRDALRMLADACHRRSFPLSLYYAVISNHHPSYPNQGRAYELPAPEPGDEPDAGKYIRFVKSQIEELCTGYGQLHGFWWDAGPLLKEGPDASAFAAWFESTIRRLQPAAVINNRGFGTGDFDTPERDWYGYVRDVLLFDRPTEACNSVGVESWGYRKDEDYYSVRYLCESIDRTMTKGGNYLLNVGPMGDGDFPPAACSILAGIGRWFGAVKESFYGAEPVSYLLDKDGIIVDREVLLTRKGSSIYVHLPSQPHASRVLLRPIDVLPSRAVLLNTGEPVKSSVDMVPSLHHEQKGFLRLYDLPVSRMADEVMVIRLDFPSFPLSAQTVARKLAEYRERIGKLSTGANVVE